jgi:hypothetical protein
MITFKAHKKCDHPNCPETMEVEMGISDDQVPILFEYWRANNTWGTGYDCKGHRCPAHKV